MTRNIISFHALFRQGFQFYFVNVIGNISVFKDDFFVFKIYPCNGIYETVVVENLNNFNYNLNVDSSADLDKACLWHYLLGHINKKRIAQLQKDGVLESFELKSDDTCESC